MNLLLPLLGMLFTVIATVTALVFCLAMGANSTPAQLRAIKLWMAGFSLLGVLGIVLSIVLIRFGHTGWAAGVAFLPTVIIAIIFTISVLK